MRRKTARAIEWVEDLYEKDPSLTKPTDISFIIHDIVHLVTQFGTDWHGEMKTALPFMGALDLAAGKNSQAKEKAFIVAYAKKSNGCFFRPDGTLCAHTDGDYRNPEYLVCRRNKTFQEQAARSYYHQTVRELLPIAQYLVDLHDGRIPEYRELLNLRIGFDDAGALTTIRRPNAAETQQDQLAPLRDVMSGIMLDEHGNPLAVSNKKTTIAPRAPQPLPEYTLAAWYAKTFPDVAPLIIASPDDITRWRAEKGACRALPPAPNL